MAQKDGYPLASVTANTEISHFQVWSYTEVCEGVQNAITGLSNPYNRTHQADLKGSEDRADWWHLAFGTGETG